MAFLFSALEEGIAVALGSDHVWFATTRNPEILEVPALPMDASGNPIPGESILRHGCFMDKEQATAFLRRKFKRCRKTWSIFPQRVIITGGMDDEAHRHFVRDALFNAGARDILTLESGMAAALGCGYSWDGSDCFPVLVVERDWMKYCAVLKMEAAAAFAMRMDFATSAAFAIAAQNAGHPAWGDLAMRLREVHQKLAPEVWRGIVAKPLTLVGAFAEAPGLAPMLEKLLDWPVICAAGSRTAPARGTLEIFRHLKSIFARAKKQG